MCRVLGFNLAKGVSKFIRRLSADEHRRLTPGQIGGKGMSSATIINEAGLNRLIRRSNLPHRRHQNTAKQAMPI